MMTRLHKVRVGLYTTGLKAYWPQFAGLRERLEAYGRFIADGLAAMGDGVEVFNFGLVDCSDKARQLGAPCRRGSMKDFIGVLKK